MSAVAETEKEQMDISYVKRQLVKVMPKECLEDGITKAEYLSLLDDSRAMDALRHVGVDLMMFMDHADFVFQDDSEEDGATSPDAGELAEKFIPFPDFLEVLAPQICHF